MAKIMDDNKTDYTDAWKMFSNIDPETGLDYDWLDIKNVLLEDEQKGVGKALPMIFDYYRQRCEKMDDWCLYLLACSHFTPKELGDPYNRASRRGLEAKVKKLMKERGKHLHMNVNQFLYENHNSH